MAIYDKNGNELYIAYDKNGDEITAAYDAQGNIVYAKYDPPSDDPYIDGRTLVFEDNFNFFNSQKWTPVIGTWIATQNASQMYREPNISFADSCLILTAKKESYGGRTWTSGAITGQLKQSFLYGRIEAKIKFPGVKGAFAAFWMVGSNFWKEFVDDKSDPINHGTIWPKSGEIDITETIPGDTTAAQANLWKYSGGFFGAGRSRTIVLSNWNVYAIEWTDKYIAALVNGNEYKRWTFANYDANDVQAYHLPFYILLNLAIGLNGGTPAESTTEMKMYVDWVRVYAPLSE